eukprot:TRINITY_DN11241_c0_g1_i2.p1 TRINITY_DN11241_c0_g1~~TRINITY_DN11241_c0_g1_i2.p1  ORF type:complete len:178 (-),score=30.13 TRINITY_DN11241_c0_g1_i2:219-752(-)
MIRGGKSMYKLVLLRHGESEWNKLNFFTGWTDVDLSEKGIEEAKRSGTVLKEEGYEFDVAYTSVLKRAIKTLNYALEGIDELWLPVYKSWRLNERHYGDLQGLNKAETAEKFGAEQVKKNGEEAMIYSHPHSIFQMTDIPEKTEDMQISQKNSFPNPNVSRTHSKEFSPTGMRKLRL